MQYRFLGRTGLRVSCHCASFGRSSFLFFFERGEVTIPCLFLLDLNVDERCWVLLGWSMFFSGGNVCACGWIRCRGYHLDRG